MCLVVELGVCDLGFFLQLCDYRLDVQSIIQVLTLVAACVEEIHNRGIIHFDLKLSNFLLVECEEEDANSEEGEGVVECVEESARGGTTGSAPSVGRLGDRGFRLRHELRCPHDTHMNPPLPFMMTISRRAPSRPRAAPPGSAPASRTNTWVSDRYLRTNAGNSARRVGTRKSGDAVVPSSTHSTTPSHSSHHIPPLLRRGIERKAKEWWNVLRKGPRRVRTWGLKWGGDKKILPRRTKGMALLVECLVRGFSFDEVSFNSII